MKKIVNGLFLFAITLLVLLPVAASAKEGEYVFTDLSEACREEGIKFNHPNYKMTTDKVNVYILRGNGCSHCIDLLNYFEAIVDDYGEYFNIITYETWDNSNNSKLKELVLDELNISLEGVPFMVIGEEYFSGYSETMNESILSKIKEEYGKEARYDVMKKLNVDSYDASFSTEKNKETNISNLVIIVISVLIISAVTLVTIIARKQN